MDITRSPRPIRAAGLGRILAAAVGAGLALLVAGGAYVGAQRPSGGSEFDLPLAQDGQYALTIGIARPYCAYSTYQTYGASGCGPDYRWNCDETCLYAGYRMPGAKRELMLELLAPWNSTTE